MSSALSESAAAAAGPAECGDGTPSSSSSPHRHGVAVDGAAVVQLAIYDLSRGMAKTLSASFLGGPDRAIEMVPHTGILVYGREYFYGSGGLSAESPDHFRSTRGIEPVRILTAGTTTVPQRDFDRWCRAVSSPPPPPSPDDHHDDATTTTVPLFHASRYNLFDNNCNHFSHRALVEGLRVVQGNNDRNNTIAGVPQWILDVPQKFLASPFGQLARPLLENMQVSGGVPFTTNMEEEGNRNNNIMETPEYEDQQQQDDNQETVTQKEEKMTPTTTKKTLHPRQEEEEEDASPAVTISSSSRSSSSVTDEDAGDISDSSINSIQPSKSKVQKLSHTNNNHENNPVVNQ